MSYFLSTLVQRNAPLYYLGWVCLLGALGCAGLVWRSTTQVMGANAWLKPLKFFTSIALFVWTMGWYLGYLGTRPAVTAYTWVVVTALTLELLWITGQAACGQRSHFNISSAGNAALSAAMGVVITIMTGWTGYMGWLFYQEPLPGLPSAYAWAIRLGIGLFVLFAFEGGLIVRQGGHTVGGADGGPGLPGLAWSTRYGDLRVAHFVGMHALQVLPLLAWYGQLSGRSMGVLALCYATLAGAVLLLALQGRPLRRRAAAPAAPIA